MSKEYNRSYIHIDELDDPSNCIARRLNLSRKSFVSNESNCPTTFLWRGIYILASVHILYVRASLLFQ